MKTSTKLLLILLIITTFISGKTVIAYAKKPVKTLTIEVTPHEPVFGLILKGEFDFENYRAWGFKYQWYIREPIYDAPWVPWGEENTVWFDKHKKTGYDINIPYDLTPDSYYSYDVKKKK